MDSIEYNKQKGAIKIKVISMKNIVFYYLQIRKIKKADSLDNITKGHGWQLLCLYHL